MTDTLSTIKNLSEALKIHAQFFANKSFIILDHNNTFSFNKVNQLVNSCCQLFKSLKLKPGDVVSAIIKNDIDYFILYTASLRYGTVFNPYPSTLDTADIQRYLEKVNPAVVFCQERHLDLQKRIPYKTILVDPNFISDLDKEMLPYPDFEPGPESPACLYYSSGTTGNPKNILISHHNMVSNIASIVRGFKFTDADRHFIILPLGHTAAINYSFLPTLLTGASILIAESFWKVRAKFWTLIKEFKITYVQLVPSILLALLNTPYKREDYAGMDSLRYIGCGSSTLPKERQTAFIKKYGIKTANLYGLSETGPTHIDYPLEKDWKPGSIGIPLDVNTVQIVSEDGSVLENGEAGEITIKGANIFIGYRGNRELYNKVVTDGYFYTGDIGYIDKNGRHFFIGRKKELIIKGGINIAPDEIDEIIYKLESVSEALTAGKADEYLGEKIVTYIVQKQEHSISEDDVLNHCKLYLSRDKVPDEIIFVSRIPKGHSGKLLRKKMRNC
ncbi:MAG: acyl--CoA ligase [Calditrichales bacterium]|nr:acyl--CoA ligase [Calditrichales bacterium]